MLCWNVYYGDFNSGEIKLYNIFNHWAFYNACCKAKRKYKDDKEGFAKEVRSNLMYFFWSKCEWEIILDHWPNGELYDMRTCMKAGELIDMLGSAGHKPHLSALSESLKDRDVMIKAYLNPSRYEKIKIDVYDQVKNNWDVFIDYLWEHRKELKARK